MLTIVCAGPKATRRRFVEVLEEAGYEVYHGADADHDYGLPSHVNHDEALAAGRPNAGHTPGTPHPVTGEDYSPDPRQTFLKLFSPAVGEERSVVLGKVWELGEPLGWRHRMYWSTDPEPARRASPSSPFEEISDADRLTRAEADLTYLRQKFPGAVDLSQLGASS